MWVVTSARRKKERGKKRSDLQKLKNLYSIKDKNILWKICKNSNKNKVQSSKLFISKAYNSKCQSKNDLKISITTLAFNRLPSNKDKFK